MCDFQILEIDHNTISLKEKSLVLVSLLVFGGHLCVRRVGSFVWKRSFRLTILENNLENEFCFSFDSGGGWREVCQWLYSM